MTDEQTTLQEQLANLKKQNLIDGQAEINAVLERRHLALLGVPQFKQTAQGWAIVVAVGVVDKAGDA